jgi:uncharacterized membrane protein YoaT (DUF817 family)
LKKRSKKLFDVSAAAFPDRDRPRSQKFFGSFFQKRMRLLPNARAEWPLIAALSSREARVGAWVAQRGPLASAAYEFLRFGIKQGWACLFGGLLLALILATRLWYPHDAPLSRYDALVIAAVLIQASLLLFRLETLAEARVILAFHVVGTVMELFKTSVGSWRYPEMNVIRLGHVPLFSGFMYAAVGSYLFRVWRLLDFRFTHHPPLPALVGLSLAIYANFFADHWGIDFRYALLATAALLFRRTTIYFKVWTVHRHMPLLLGFCLVALFIWFGENIGTASGAWLYPNQLHGWAMVSPQKLPSWLLLMLISYTLVALANARAFSSAGKLRASSSLSQAGATEDAVSNPHPDVCEPLPAAIRWRPEN